MAYNYNFHRAYPNDCTKINYNEYNIPQTFIKNKS